MNSTQKLYAFLISGAICFTLAVGVIVHGQSAKSAAVVHNQKLLEQIETMRDEGIIVENYSLLGQVPEPKLTVHYITAGASCLAGLCLVGLAFRQLRLAKHTTNRAKDDSKPAEDEHSGKPD